MNWGWSWSSIIALVAIVVTIVLYLFDRRSAKQSRDSETERREEDIRSLNERLSALKRQADALTKQADIAERLDSIPKWSLRNIKGIIFEVENGNAFTALEVKVESVPEDGNTGRELFSKDLGNITPGSSQTFEFLLAMSQTRPEKMRITWHSPESKDRLAVVKPLPPTNR